jgi:hypothetical protein
VPQRDPDAIGTALRTVLSQPAVAGRMADTAARAAPGLLWSAIAERYAHLAGALVGRELVATTVTPLS